MPVLDQTDLLKLSELIEKEEAEAARLRVDADKMRDAIRTADKWTPDDLNRLDEAYKPSDHKRDQIVQMRQQYNRLAGTPADGTQLPTNGSTATSPASQFSPFDPGERFTGSEPYRRFREVVKAGRKLDVAWLSELKDGVEVMNRKESKDSNFGVRQRAVTLTNLPWSERQPDQFVPLAARPVVLLDLISMATTDGPSIDYQQQTARTDAAAATAYGTLLPEHSLTIINVNVVVNRIGTWTPATRGAATGRRPATGPHQRRPHGRLPACG